MLANAPDGLLTPRELVTLYVPTREVPIDKFDVRVVMLDTGLYGMSSIPDGPNSLNSVTVARPSVVAPVSRTMNL